MLGSRKSVAAVALAILLALMAVAQQGPPGASQEIPDAPSASKPLPESPFPAGTPPAPKSNPDASVPNEPPVNTPPAAEIRTAPQGQSTPEARSGSDELMTFAVTVNNVIVPVTVRDDSGRLVEGLAMRDFSVYEDGVRQPINFFTSDPFPLSVAVLLDMGMPDVTMRKVNETLPNIVGAFSQFDEVALYTYGNNVDRVQDFAGVTERLGAAIKRVRRPGRQGGVAVAGGPMNAGPTVNGRPFDPSMPQVATVRRESRVMNDAILLAAQDLAKRNRARRKIIFVISDGREDGSRASYQDVLKILLSNEISVYAVAVGDAALPGYDRLAKIHIPRTGYANILPKYSSATGGQVIAEFTREAIEDAYALVTETARNQYTLGYTTRATAASNYRSIEVRVLRGGLRVFARDGYYPLPPPRPQGQSQPQ